MGEIDIEKGKCSKKLKPPSDDTMFLTSVIEFLRQNVENLIEKGGIIFFQTFFRAWIQVSTVSNIFNDKKMF